MSVELILLFFLAVFLISSIYLFISRNSIASEKIRLEERGIANEKELNRLNLEKVELESEFKAIEIEHKRLLQNIAELKARREEEEEHSKEKLALLKDMEVRLNEQFKLLANDALKSNNQSFLELAKSNLEKFQVQAKGDLDLRKKEISTLVDPLKDSLKKVDKKITEIEEARNQAYGSLRQHLVSLSEAQADLKKEAHNLTKALRAPSVRGRWGEIQLKRVVEIAGMLNYCDFLEQESGDTSRLRPDLIVKLPNNKNVVVDSKAPLQAYLEALDQDSEAGKLAKLKEHASHIRSHLSILAKKNYWDQFSPTPEFVVMFLPGEIFFSAALEQDPALIEVGIDQRVILATPTTLIALLRAVAYGWRHEKLAENAEQISELGKELYDRLYTLSTHFTHMKSGIDRTVESYNKALGSFESRVMVSARKFKELGSGSSKEIAEGKVIEKATRAIQQEDAYINSK